VLGNCDKRVRIEPDLAHVESALEFRQGTRDRRLEVARVVRRSLKDAMPD